MASEAVEIKDGGYNGTIKRYSYSSKDELLMKIFNSAPKKGIFAWFCSSQAHVLEGQDKEKGNVANRSRLSPTYHKRSFCFVYASASASPTIPFCA